MNWTEPQPPTDTLSYYDHIICKSPLGEFIIEWNSWKDSSSYCVILDDFWIASEYDLDSAKNCAKKYLEEKSEELIKYLK